MGFMRNKNQVISSTAPAIMVTGSSGFIGQSLVAKLVNSGRTVVAVYRHTLPDSMESAYPVCTDLSSAELIAAPLRGVDTVVHLAWDGGLAGPDTPLISDPLKQADQLTKNLLSLKNLITAMERAGSKRLVFLSAVGADPDSSNSFLREKYQAELMLINSRIPEKIILRSSVVWGGRGSEDRFITSIRRILRYRLYPVPRHHGRLSPIHLVDLVSALNAASIASVKLEVSIGELSGGESYQIEELLKLVSQSVIGRVQFAMKGIFGESLLSLFERDRNLRIPRIQQFLGLSTTTDHNSHVHDNPLNESISKDIPGFKERLEFKAQKVS